MKTGSELPILNIYNCLKIGLLERHKITVLQLKKENVLSEIIKGLISDQSLGEIQVSDSVIMGKSGVELE